ncbi:hypothetical protein A8B79_09290 [Balneola sp. EhC07]|uniref:hypothetical protein n=1 Tax=Balneola sp. EhC07 TaxID=1849360 RepID=UPI0007F34FDC|nr:hypothetical protein [Balneola sp. EhC07]OAN60706.1 hypothetical protein A8B79_09290 [Balneola sp. EhC07]
MLRFKFIAFVFLVPVSAFAQIDSLSVLPGRGLVIKSDTIFINKTTIEETMNLLEINELPPLGYATVSGVNLDTGEFFCEAFVTRELKFLGINFDYEGETEKDLKLKWIRISVSDSYFAKFSETLFLGQFNPKIDSFFPEVSKYDYVSEDSLTYNLYSSGISFSLKGKEQKILNEISVHYKIKE